MAKVKRRTGKGTIFGVVWKRSGGKSIRTTGMMAKGRYTKVRKGK